MKYKQQCSECENIVDLKEMSSWPLCEIHRERLNPEILNKVYEKDGLYDQCVKHWNTAVFDKH
jgi:hypothetical protein